MQSRRKIGNNNKIVILKYFTWYSLTLNFFLFIKRKNRINHKEVKILKIINPINELFSSSSCININAKDLISKYNPKKISNNRHNLNPFYSI